MVSLAMLSYGVCDRSNKTIRPRLAAYHLQQWSWKLGNRRCHARIEGCWDPDFDCRGICQQVDSAQKYKESSLAVQCQVLRFERAEGAALLSECVGYHSVAQHVPSIAGAAKGHSA